MNKLEKNMAGILADLKENYHVVGVKAEFEAEGTRMEEALRLKEVVSKADLALAIKIGGCEAIKDMYDAKVIGVNKIIAPMIETAYALKKYIQATHFVYQEEEEYNEVKFMVNLETITGYKNMKEMLALPEAKDLTGFVLGRVDMTGSMGLTREDINSEEIFKIAEGIGIEALKAGKQMTIGGGVSIHSLPLFQKLPANSLNNFETRKIIFDAQKAMVNPKIKEGILKAVGFELMWLKNKRDFYGMIFKEDETRIVMLESRYKKLIEEVGGKYE